MGLKIIGTGIGIPARSVTNDELAAFVDTSDEWIFSRTGIRSRHVCTDESMTDLCETAAGEALQNAGLAPEKLDLILCSTIGGDYLTPSLACAVAERLGTDCAALDLNAACSGFIYGLELAEAYLLAGKAQNILLICCEMMTKHVDWTDRSTCVLFGDGAGAVVLTGGDALKYIRLTASGNTRILNLPGPTGNSPFLSEKRAGGYLYMAGQDVFKFAVGMIEKEAKRAVEALALTLEDVDYFVLHQANRRILTSAAARLKQPEEKFPMNIERYGNISSASVPILLHELLAAGKIVPGTRLFMSAFGAGLTTGSCYMIWE